MASAETIVAVIQARMSSTRLPGKVLRDLGGRSVLHWVVDAARATTSVDDVIVATSIEDSDEAVAAECRALGVECHRGPIDDVLTRFVEAVAAHRPGAVVRLTADCPLLDPSLIDAVAQTWRCTGVDYVSTIARRSLPRGLDVELVSEPTLERLDAQATGVDRVHVTSHIRRDPEQFSTIGIEVTPNHADLRATLDTDEDAALLDRVVADLGHEASSWRVLTRYLRENPNVAALNQTVEQKAMDEG